MISRWYCVNCDNCGDPGPLAETVHQARKEASALGWTRKLSDKLRPTSGAYEDLCPRHSRKEPNQ